ncbi:hypothetical protein SSPO_098740 [Streptomyces antimycoticus]|uniref:Uncharacterized protein n=1 Tax=Streptomyces antimycoticus TaxID=68175 RepID=A0A499VG38_9ACTN|nr:hypothetical protein SSPO_098740 [Streptomyces antimycoticus]
MVRDVTHAGGPPGPGADARARPRSGRTAPLFDAPPYPGLTVERHGEWERVGGSTDDAADADATRGDRLLEDRARGLARAIQAFDAASRSPR